eukprot:TRINITY_DN32082_c0_g1_i3.p1 TRINITY_DN32082_c0_g1~~TRINITY_DN32082_c0_g1_i3.p1  ORF type:complete len:372 (-),score=27.15 TRINITY_DN32082_c0_g1_i3:36-1151(-)
MEKIQTDESKSSSGNKLEIQIGPQQNHYATSIHLSVLWQHPSIPKKLAPINVIANNKLDDFTFFIFFPLRDEAQEDRTLKQAEDLFKKVIIVIKSLVKGGKELVALFNARFFVQNRKLVAGIKLDPSLEARADAYIKILTDFLNQKQKEEKFKLRLQFGGEPFVKKMCGSSSTDPTVSVRDLLEETLKHVRLHADLTRVPSEFLDEQLFGSLPNTSDEGIKDLAMLFTLLQSAGFSLKLNTIPSHYYIDQLTMISIALEDVKEMKALNVPLIKKIREFAESSLGVEGKIVFPKPDLWVSLNAHVQGLMAIIVKVMPTQQFCFVSWGWRVFAAAYKCYQTLRRSTFSSALWEYHSFIVPCLLYTSPSPRDQA